MSLLSEIQETLLTDGSSIGMALLKLRYLASRIGSEVLEEWVSHEIEGYPDDAPVPEYRRTSIIYTGTFSNGYQILNRVPVAPYLIGKHAGEKWLHHEIRGGMDVIDDLIKRTDVGGHFSVDTGDLTLLLHGKIYEGFNCIELKGVFDVSAFIRVQSTVRARILGLTVNLEKAVPSALEITRSSKIAGLSFAAQKQTDNVTHMTVYNAPVTNISNAGQVGGISVNVAYGNIESLVTELVSRGIPKNEANELADIMKDEAPGSPQQPFGERAFKWVSEKLEQSTEVAWKIGKATASALLTEAAKKYYGLP